MSLGLLILLEKHIKDTRTLFGKNKKGRKIKAEKFFELLITYLKGGMSRMKLAEKLGISFSQLKIYLEKIEKMIIEEFKIAFGIMEEKQ